MGKDANVMLIIALYILNVKYCKITNEKMYYPPRSNLICVVYLYFKSPIEIW